MLKRECIHIDDEEIQKLKQKQKANVKYLAGKSKNQHNTAGSNNELDTSGDNDCEGTDNVDEINTSETLVGNVDTMFVMNKRSIQISNHT